MNDQFYLLFLISIGWLCAAVSTTRQCKMAMEWRKERQSLQSEISRLRYFLDRHGIDAGDPPQPNPGGGVN